MRQEKIVRSVIVASMVILLFFAIAGAAEEGYPTKPINIVNPWGPGGSADLGYRPIIDVLPDYLGQKLNMLYKTGGGTAIGGLFAARSKPDGYTLYAATTSTVVLAPAVRKLAYSIDDFVFAGGFGKALVGLAVPADSPWNTLQDLVADAKKNPGKFKYATPGVGTLTHFLVERFNGMAGINTVVIPVKSDAEVLTDLLGGHVAFGTLIQNSWVLYVPSGKIRLLAIFDTERSKLFPNVPTFKELGYDIEGPILSGLAAPKGTPKAVIDKIYGSMKKAFDDKKLQPLIEKTGWTPTLVSPEDMDKRFKREALLYSKLAKELGIEIK